MRSIDADKLLRDIEKYHLSDGKFQHWVQIQPTIEQEKCEDTVSRNAIIQKLNTMDRYVSEELRLCDTDKKFPKNEVFIVDDVYEEIVEDLPPVSERKRGKWTKENACEFCGFQPWFERDIHTLSFCPNCGADMRG